MKHLKVLLVALMLCGIIVSAVNFFAPCVEAGDFWGTITLLPGVPPNPNNPAYIYDEYWCLGAPCNCVVVYPI